MTRFAVRKIWYAPKLRHVVDTETETVRFTGSLKDCNQTANELNAAAQLTQTLKDHQHQPHRGKRLQ